MVKTLADIHLEKTEHLKDTNPEELYHQLIDGILKYHPSADISMIEKAYKIANNAHKGQLRKSGEPYIIHPLCVGIILTELELDKETITAGILHDVVEDTQWTTEEITRFFSLEVALLVDGVTKLERLPISMDKMEVQAENLRKMFLAMAKDIRVILIKLADRLHNMRTLRYQSPEKQKKIATETLDIYAPIAHRLGISKIKVELEDLCLKFLHEDIYYDLAQKITLTKDSREELVENIVKDIQRYMTGSGILAETVGRAKHFFSIYRKMINQNKTLEQIYDLFAVRIVVRNVKDCYAALGLIHERYTPIHGRFKDYIAMPKPNMYQSIHTTLIAGNGDPFEVQIRTFQMHRTAEYGIAAHWKYKETSVSNNILKSEEEKLSWLRQILDWQRELSDNREFLSLLKNDLDLFSDSIYCFTPTGDVKTLPNGSTTIDFAYCIHSAVGNKMVGSRVNERMVPIDYVIQNGDRIEIITSQNSKGPSRDWLSIAKSTQAKNKINQWFKNESKEDNIAKGKDLLEKYCKAKVIALSSLYKPELMEKVQKKYGFYSWELVLAALGHGGLKEGQVINKMLEEDGKKGNQPQGLDNNTFKNYNKKLSNTNPQGGIVVNGADDISVRFSKCCNPVPGDEIIGFVTRGRGVSIHRTDCINLINLSEMDRARLTDAEWKDLSGTPHRDRYTAEVKIFANNRTGILTDVTKLMSEGQIDVTAMDCRINKEELATINISFHIHEKEELQQLIDKIRSIKGIVDIERTTG